jgi:hypothetical protein
MLPTFYRVFTTWDERHTSELDGGAWRGLYQNRQKQKHRKSAASAVKSGPPKLNNEYASYL